MPGLVRTVTLDRPTKRMRRTYAVSRGRSRYTRAVEMQKKNITSQGNVAAGAAVVLNLTNVLQGDGADDRSGTQIRAYRAELRGTCAAGIDIYLIQGHGATAPVSADFPGSCGSYISDAKNNSVFTEWGHTSSGGVNSSVDGRFKLVRNFRGMRVRYNGNTAQPVYNAIYVVIRNGTGAALDYNLGGILWFTE